VFIERTDNNKISSYNEVDFTDKILKNKTVSGKYWKFKQPLMLHGNVLQQ
jgi:hypothetical protein